MVRVFNLTPHPQNCPESYASNSVFFSSIGLNTPFFPMLIHLLVLYSGHSNNWWIQLCALLAWVLHCQPWRLSMTNIPNFPKWKLLSHHWCSFLNFWRPTASMSNIFSSQNVSGYTPCSILGHPLSLSLPLHLWITAATGLTCPVASIPPCQTSIPKLKMYLFITIFSKL